MPEEMTQPVTGMEQPVAENEQTQALLALLKENNSPGCREFAELITHMSGMERQLSDALEELQAMRQKMQEVQDRSLKAVLLKSGRALEKNVDAMHQRLLELKEQIVDECRNILEDFKERGVAALNGIVRFLQLKPAFEAVQAAAESSVQASDRAVSRIDAFSTEFHEAGRHLKNMGRSLIGKGAEAEIRENGNIARAFKGAFKVERSFASAIIKRTERAQGVLGRLEQAAECRPSVLQAMKGQAAKAESAKNRQTPIQDKGGR